MLFTCLSPYQILICVSIYTMLVLCPRCFFWTTCLLGYSDFTHVFHSICILPLSNLIALIFKKFLETYQYFELVIRNLNILCPFHNHYFGLHSHETTTLWFQPGPHRSTVFMSSSPHVKFDESSLTCGADWPWKGNSHNVVVLWKE